MKTKNPLSLSLSLSPSRLPRTIITCTTVFLLCLATGLLSGTLLRTNQKPAEAASASITVTNNNQVVTEDQGTTTIVRTSTVTIKDISATIGYKLSAKLAQNSITGATVAIYPTTTPTAPNTSPCTESSPCTLPADDVIGTTTPRMILETANANAVASAGDTTEWTIAITLPGGTAQGNYIVDIAYSEDPKFPMCPVIAGKTYLQDVSPATTANHSTLDRERVVLKDRRNNQDYYVQNIVNSNDNSCLAWMETNLRYAGDGSWSGSWNYPDDRYATTSNNNTANTNDDTRPLLTPSSGYLGGSSTSSYAMAGYFSPGGSTNYTNTSPGDGRPSGYGDPATWGFFGYLYNWCAAMGGQPNACNQTSTTGFDTTTSICPAGWRLPTGGLSSNDFRAMVETINGKSAVNYADLIDNFLAVHSGTYTSALTEQGASGGYWSSTVYASYPSQAFGLAFSNNNAISSSWGSKSRIHGWAVRCIL